VDKAVEIPLRAKCVEQSLELGMLLKNGRKRRADVSEMPRAARPPALQSQHHRILPREKRAHCLVFGLRARCSPRRSLLENKGRPGSGLSIAASLPLSDK
jgi:hypothetical protein